MKYTNILFLILSLSFLTACFKGKKVDLIIHNAKIYTLNNENATEEAIAIKDGKIVEVGPERQILNKYTADEEFDASGKSITPGFYDLQVDLIEAAKSKLALDLNYTSSSDELFTRLDKFQQLNQSNKIIIAKNLDLNNSSFRLDYERFNQIFKEISVIIYLKNSDSVIINKFLENQLKQSNSIQKYSKKAIEAFLPKYKESDLTNNILKFERSFLQYGIVGIQQTNCSLNSFQLFKKLTNTKKLTIELNCLLNWNIENKEFYIKNYKKIPSALLRGFYIEKLNDNHLSELSNAYSVAPFQLYFNDLNGEYIDLFDKLMSEIKGLNPDHRWMYSSSILNKPIIELIDNNSLFYNSLISKDLFNNSNYSTLPNQLILTTTRSNFPKNEFYPYQFLASGYLHEMSLNRLIEIYTKNANLYLKKETKRGTLEKGKDATFVIFNQSLNVIADNKPLYAYKTYIKGKMVYSAE